ncbi:MAG: hypothetical protein J07HQW1_02800 [Haloquadratum walsbyi J07HQW1]|jgi:hypothetical protein|uniref:Uncharacterized protein n=1 Tax=Haloquadratum walsbyi J07HQW1 TaxID=1238424 RepID=U1N8A6_9EURY|nr:MAG: hypothetical protein J07HQW1_02800 [Haloquadratum walsbyi J07HQW1]
MVSDKEQLSETIRWLKEVKRLKQDSERLYSNSYLQGYRDYVIPPEYRDMDGVSEDELEQIIQRYERDLKDLQTGNFQR